MEESTSWRDWAQNEILRQRSKTSDKRATHTCVLWPMTSKHEKGARTLWEVTKLVGTVIRNWFYCRAFFTTASFCKIARITSNSNLHVLLEGMGQAHWMSLRGGKRRKEICKAMPEYAETKIYGKKLKSYTHQTDTHSFSHSHSLTNTYSLSLTYIHPTQTKHTDLWLVKESWGKKNCRNSLRVESPRLMGQERRALVAMSIVDSIGARSSIRHPVLPVSP
jgi:hypothetical protein